MADQNSSHSRGRSVLGISIIVVIAVALLGFVFVNKDGKDNVALAPSPDLSSDLKTAPEKGALAPDFALQNLAGEEVRLSDFRGQTVLINLWATWCGPCRLEMPAFEDKFQKFEDDGFVVLAVNFDESAEDVAEFRDELGLSFELLLDPGAEIQNLYRNRTYPSSFFVDEDGVIQVQHIGVMTEDQLDGYLEQFGLGT